MKLNRPRLEVCGGIGTGKTTFASLLSNPEISVIHEDFSKNPFWEAYYQNPGKQFIFETEITFLLQHYHDIKRQGELANIIIADYSFITDLAYARIGLSSVKQEIFKSIYQVIIEEIGLPRLLVRLRCEATIQAERVAGRGHDEENMIDIGFLEKLNRAIEEEMSELSPQVKVIEINSELEDFAHDETIREKWRGYIRNELNELLI